MLDYVLSVKSPRGLKRKSKKRMKRNNKLACPKTIVTRHHERERVNMIRERALKEELAETLSVKQEIDTEGSLNDEGSHEPEPAEEPVGPDQTLPVPTVGQQEQPTKNCAGMSGDPPRERAVPSYINVRIIVLSIRVICLLIYFTKL